MRVRGARADVLVAVAVTGVQIAAVLLAGRDQPERASLDVFGVGLLAVGGLVLAVRRRHPVVVLWVVVASTLAYSLTDYPAGGVVLALIVAFFTAQTRGHRVAGFGAIALLYVTFVWNGALMGTEPGPGLGEAVAIAAWMLVLVAVAEIVRVRRAYVGEVRERAREAERARAEEALRRQGEERLRIARELHDVLAHNISLMNVQASTALHLLDEHPQQARPALTAIKRASSEALGELRAVLDALRQVGEAPPRTPAPGLSGLGDLVSQAATAGLPVETVVEGVARPLPARVELAAFRICQEAVTNVIRHAGPASARVRLAYGEGELVVQIDDDGRGAASNGGGGGGNGLVGMRERAAALGGSVEAGPRAGGGFRVRARLPLEEAP
jgi:signal transduction histidine kinase